jgi:hypothetical protein
MKKTILTIALIAFLFAVANTEEKEPGNLTLESGFNILKIDVTNLQVNRFTIDERYPDGCDWLTGNYLNDWPRWLTGDQQRPVPARVITTWKHWKKDEQLSPSGLVGPVKLRCAKLISVK